jgi:predicted AlkP superfamily phosphohydrolase/phosphomutase
LAGDRLLFPESETAPPPRRFEAQMSERLLIIGWDGADWQILDALLARGHLPNLATMVEEGARGTLLSTIPAHSWAAWASFLTGRHPSGHGVFDFVERDPMNPRRRIPTSSGSLRAQTFLERLSATGHEVRSGNVPVTFPPFPVRGRMIGGVAVPSGAGFVFPPEWKSELDRRAPFPLGGMEWTRFSADPGRLVEQADRMVERRTASFEALLEGQWEVAVCVYVAPDRLQHPFAGHLHPSHPAYPERSETRLAEQIRGVFERLDAGLGRLRASAGEDATVVLMSDHGFRPITRTCDLATLLQHLGFLRRSSTARITTGIRRWGPVRALLRTEAGQALKRRAKVPAVIDWNRSIAYFSASGGGISLNLQGREPLGVVPEADYDRVREEIREALLSFRDPESGDAPVQAVSLREELPPGPYLHLAPDLIARPAPMWSFAHARGLTGPTEWPAGTHRRAGVVVAHGGRATPGPLGERHIVDLGATAMAFCGVGVDDLDGVPIEQIAGRARAGAPVPTSNGQSENNQRRSPSDEENLAIARHLRRLGYIE